MDEATDRRALAERAARAGGSLALESFRSALSVETKRGKNDLVTETDRAAQRRVVGTVRDERPDEPFVCEEDAAPADGGTSLEGVPATGPAWVVDPIDGTANFVRGSRLWTTSVAAVVDGAPVAAATNQPALGDTYVAGPDRATRNGEALSVSDRTDPTTFAVGLLGWWPGDATDAYAAVFEGAVRRFGDVRRVGSDQSVLAMVAEGSLEAAVTARGVPPWDSVAGVHLIERAGGTVTDLAGDPWTHDAGALVASNGEAHDAARAVARRGADAGRG